jgi:lysophospholipase L1-like esterase
MLSVIPGSAIDKPAAAGSAFGEVFAGKARGEPLLTVPGGSGSATVSVHTPTLAEADAILEPDIVAATRRRADALSMRPEWMRREAQVPGAYRAFFWHGALQVYNSDRLRMVGQPPAKDPKWFRVLVLGDSLTYGDGIEERFTYSRQLESLLRRRWRVEVVNAGVDGAQSEDIVHLARRLIPRLQPDLVVYGVCLNDFLPSGVAEYDGSFHLPELIHARTRIGPVVELLMSNALTRLGLARDFFDDILHAIPSYRHRFAHDVDELNRLVRAQGIPPVIALVLDQFPELGGRGQHIAGLAEQALAAAGMTVLNSDDYYRRFSELSPLRVSRWEGHPNEEANAVWALMLEQVVQRDARLATYGSAGPN